MSRRPDGGSKETATCKIGAVQTEAPAQDGTR
jgi:hypothetical protein